MIDRNVGTGRDLSDGKGHSVGAGRDLSNNVNPTATGHDLSNINNPTGTGHDLSNNPTGTGRDLSLPKIKPLSELMGAYKTTVSKQIHLAGYAGFIWQRSFHDHIIRDEKSYENIANYIIDNPKTWDQDKFYKVGTGRDLSRM